jgi:hypothetical protein
LPNFKRRIKIDEIAKVSNYVLVGISNNTEGSFYAMLFKNNFMMLHSGNCAYEDVAKMAIIHDKL